MTKSIFVTLFMLVAGVAVYAQVDSTTYEYCQMVVGRDRMLPTMDDIELEAMPM